MVRYWSPERTVRSLKEPREEIPLRFNHHLEFKHKRQKLYENVLESKSAHLSVMEMDKLGLLLLLLLLSHVFSQETELGPWRREPEEVRLANHAVIFLPLHSQFKDKKQILR